MESPRAAPNKNDMKRFARMFAVQLAAALKESATQTASLSMNEQVRTLFLSAMYPQFGWLARSLTYTQRSERGVRSCQSFHAFWYCTFRALALTTSRHQMRRAQFPTPYQ